MHKSAGQNMVDSVNVVAAWTGQKTIPDSPFVPL